MITFRKLARELSRLGSQFVGLGQLALGPVRRWHYDLITRKQVKITQGAQMAGPNVAILLVFQPENLLASLFYELEHLKANGLSVVLVANHPLSDSELDRLKPLCHLVIQRPNIGYDFGGYREGVLAVLDAGMKPENLFILNDSIWFPLKTNCTLIDTALASPADVYGVFRNTKNRKEEHHHLQSYFYRFKGHLVADYQFQKLWRKMPIYQSKRLIIRRFEIKLTGKIESLGYHAASLLTPQDVTNVGLEMSDDELLEIAKFYARTTIRGRQIFQTLTTMTPSDPLWAAEREKAVTHGRFKYYLIDAHPNVMFNHLDVPFLKKSREYQYYFQRDALIEAGFHKEFDPIIQAELVGWNERGTPGAPEDATFQPIEARTSI